MFTSKKDAIQRLFLCPGPGTRSGTGSGKGPGTEPGAGRLIGLLLLGHLLGLFLACPASAETACPVALLDSPHYDETTRIKFIYDGDTLQLQDGRKVRLIGINTPELSHGDNAAEPYSTEAKLALQKLFDDNKTVSLVFGQKKHDHYKRLLAHGFTRDGSNIQAALLEQGLAHAVNFPPNLQFSSCYREQERLARCKQRGLWEKVKPLKAENLKPSDTGFKIVSGKIQKITINKKGIWLNLDDNLTIGIRPENQSLFDINDISRMLNRSVVVRGWINKSDKETPYYIRIRHPSALQSTEQFSCEQSS
jgi:endonuclease YncB( thermonuclease family)